MTIVSISQESLSRIKILAGSLDALTNEPLSPFSDEALSFFADLSKALREDVRAKALPDVVSFAYWCRKANILRMMQEQQQSSYFSSRLGRGLSFHVAPSNIPVNFAFSYAFALLAGNASIVRVPSKTYIQTKAICGALDSVLSKHPQIAQRTALVSYPAENNTITEELSLLADTRLVWGGDTTIAHITSLPSSPRCKNVVFSDRYSIGVINGAAISSASSAELASLAAKFYNDTYLMDQNACSSPQMIFWQRASSDDKARFWHAIRDYAAGRYELQPQIAIDKYVKLCRDVILGTVQESIKYDGLLTVADIGALQPDISGMRGVGGYFYQCDIAELVDIVPLVSERFQTLVYYGYEPKELQSFVLGSRMRGIDRVVPIGDAMDIGIIWDGYNMVSELSRIVWAR